MEPVTLAIATASLLAQRAADSMAKEAGKTAWFGLQHLWVSVRDRFAGSPRAVALDDVERCPTDRQAVGSLAVALQAEFDDDDQFRGYTEQLVRDAQRAHSIGAVINNFYRDVQIDKMATFRDVHGDVSF